MIDLLLVFLIGFFASFVGSSVGGNNLIAAPLLMSVGLPPKVAIATSHFGGFGMNLGAIVKYFKKRRILWKHAIIFTLISIPGYVIGAFLIMNIEGALVTKFAGGFILAMLPLMVYKKDIGIKKKDVTLLKKIIGYFAIFVFSIIGAFGAGANILFTYVNLLFFGLTILQHSATIRISGLFYTSITAIILFFNGYFDPVKTPFFFFSMVIGGYLGAKFALKAKGSWLRALLIIIVLFSSVNLLFFR